MSNNSGGSFATIVLALPMTAIALMAVFGVPQLTPVIASPEEQLIRRSPGTSESQTEAPLFDTTTSPQSGDFQWATSNSSHPAAQAMAANPSVQPVAQAILASQQTPGNNPPATDWRAASRRLADMGIDKYHLERGSTPGAFLFVCLVAPAGNAQVMHRFEAEHNDPLAAVNNVLGQVDQWLQERYARQSFPGTGAMSAR